MRCHKCFRDIHTANIDQEHLYNCDLCYFSRKRVLAKIKVNIKRRRRERYRRTMHKMLLKV